MKKWLKVIVPVFIFVACVSLVVYGQRQTGRINLGLMMAGLLGLMGMLYKYNAEYKE